MSSRVGIGLALTIGVAISAQQLAVQLLPTVAPRARQSRSARQPLGASGRVYLAGRNGATVVLKQTDKLEALATNKLDEKFDASPVAVGKELFLRGRQYLYCIAEK